MNLVYLKKGLLLGLLLFSLFAFLPPDLPVAYAADYEILYPTDDAYVDENNPAVNYGSNVDLKLYWHKTSTDEMYFYLKFNITSYETFELGCTLRLYVNAGSGTPTYYLQKVLDDNWNEDAVTWNSKPTLGSTLYSQEEGSVGWRAWDVTTYLQEAKDDGRNNVTFGLSYYADPAISCEMEFDSKEGTNDPELIVYGSEEGGAVSYNLYGAIDEDGYRDGSILVTLYRHDDSPRRLTADGWRNLTESLSQIAWKWDIGNNQSRTFYLYQDNVSETIYVITPTEPYYTYYVNVLDFVGVEDAYLETLLNINGTDRIVERWRVDLMNELPFTLSFGTVYKLRLVCDLGIYYYPEFVAGATTSILVPITKDMFPVTPTGISQLTVSAERVNMTHIQSIYVDGNSETNWIYMGVYEAGNTTILSSTNVSASSLTWNWYGADDKTDYYMTIIVDHQNRGELSWVKLVPAPYEAENPFAVMDSLFGTGSFPIAPSEFLGVGIILFTVACFSNKNAAIGIVLSVITAMIVTYIGLIDLSWTVLTTALGLAFIVAFGFMKDREKR